MAKNYRQNGTIFTLENSVKFITLFIMVISSSVAGYSWLESKLTKAINKAVDQRVTATINKVNQMEVDYKVSERSLSAVTHNNVYRDAFDRDVARIIKNSIDQSFEKPEDVKFEIEN